MHPLFSGVIILCAGISLW